MTREVNLTPRNYMYRLLSNFFAKELTAGNIESIRDGDTAKLLDVLKEIPSYARFIHRLEDYFADMTDVPQAALDLAESYAWLFHGAAGPQDAPLTASVYMSRNGGTFQEPETAFRDLMRHHGISYLKEANAPCDHLSVILEFVSWLGEKAERSGEAEAWRQEQERVIDTYLLSWLPDFAERCRQGDALGFYAFLAKETLEFVSEHSRQLACFCDA